MAEKTAPHGAMGIRFAPSYHRPWLRYIEATDGAEGANGAPENDATDWKAEARKWEQRAKDNKKAADDNAGAAQQLADLQNASKTAEQKTADRIAGLEKQLAETARVALVARIQAKHSISDEDADLFLTGADAEALEKQAARLAARDSERKKDGNVAPREGDAKNTSDGKKADMREFTKNLFSAAQND